MSKATIRLGKSPTLYTVPIEVKKYFEEQGRIFNLMKESVNKSYQVIEELEAKLEKPKNFVMLDDLSE
jgi:hypothetical protein